MTQLFTMRMPWDWVGRERAVDNTYLARRQEFLTHGVYTVTRRDFSFQIGRPDSPCQRASS